MRILVVQESDWIEKGPHQSHHLMERLSTRGHEIRVIDFEISWKSDKSGDIVGKRRGFEGGGKAIRDGRISVIRPPTIKLPLLVYVSLLFTHWREIKRQMKEFKPDLIVGFGILNAYIARRFAKKRDVPFVYYVIDELYRLLPEKRLQAIARQIERWNMAGADIVVSINEELREYSIAQGSRREGTAVIRAGVDLGVFDDVSPEDSTALRAKYGFSANDRVLFFMGWLYRFSGLKELLLELKNERWNDSGLKVFILGKGEEWETLQAIARQPGLEQRVILESWVSYSDVPSHIAMSDICLLPARRDEIMLNIVPIKIYEYMASRKPVISTELPGILREFGRENGVVYADTPGQVLNKAVSLLENDRASVEGDKGRRFVESLTWERITDEFEQLLESVQRRSGDLQFMRSE